MSLNYSYETSESDEDWRSMEDETNITEAWYNNTTTEMPDQMEDMEVETEWHWDSPQLWLVVLASVMTFLIIANIIIWIRCLRSANRPLNELFNDLWIYGIFLALRYPHTRRSRSGAPAEDLPVSFISTEALHPTSFRCFQDRIHAESETASRQNKPVKDSKPGFTKGDGKFLKRNTVLPWKIHNDIQGKENIAMNVNEEEDDVADGKRHLEKLNESKKGKNVFKKGMFPIEEEVNSSMEAEEQQEKDQNDKNNAIKATVWKPPRSRPVKTSKHEIFI